MRKYKIILCFVFLFAFLGMMEAGTPAQKVCVPKGKLYGGVFPGGKRGTEDDITPADVDIYEKTVGQKAAWVYFSNNWYNSREFPVETAAWIRKRGSIPF